MHETQLRNPEEKTIWRHYNGVVYEVVVIASEHSTSDVYPPTVVYRGPNGHIWSRPLSDWHRSMTFVGRADVVAPILNNPDQLPPVACPLLIEVDGALVRAERTEFVQHRGQDMVYRLVDGSTLLGRFRWTYP